METLSASITANGLELENGTTITDSPLVWLREKLDKIASLLHRLQSIDPTHTALCFEKIYVARQSVDPHCDPARNMCDMDEVTEPLLYLYNKKQPFYTLKGRIYQQQAPGATTNQLSIEWTMASNLKAFDEIQLAAITVDDRSASMVIDQSYVLCTSRTLQLQQQNSTVDVCHHSLQQQEALYTTYNGTLTVNRRMPHDRDRYLYNIIFLGNDGKTVTLIIEPTEC